MAMQLQPQSGAAASLPLHQQFAARARQHPDAIALTAGRVSLRYGELEARANQLARWLQAQGIGADSIVGICLDWAPDQLLAMLAVLKAGGAYLPLDPSLPAERLQAISRQARPQLLLTSLAWRSLPCHGEVARLCLDQSELPFASLSDAALQDKVTANQLCYLMFTSGSSGEPKGVMVTHGNVADLFAGFTSRYQLGDQDVWSWCHSFAFGFSVWEIWGALSHGGRLVAVPVTARADPVALRAQLVEQRVTVLSQTPSAFRQNLLSPEFARLDELCLRLVVLSGEAAPGADLARWFQRHADTGPRLINTYAITETAGQVSCREFSVADLRDTPADSVGHLLPGVRIKLLGADGTDAGAGDAGELLIGGMSVARGYVADEALTQARFVQRDGQRWYRSGDRFRQLADGQLEFLGRIDNQLKWRGYRIEPAEIEAVLQAQPGVHEAAVSVRENDRGESRLVAYLVPSREAQTELWPAIGPYQIYDSFLYDLMSSETQRLEKYREGFAGAVAGKAVLDIGTGEQALLARLCIEAGARHVYAVEVLPEVAEQARRSVAAMGLQHRITVISGDIAALPAPERVQVVTQGIIGNIGSADGIASIWNAASHWFAADYVAVPGLCRTFIAPVELPAALADRPVFSRLASDYAEQVFRSEGRRFDLRLCLRNLPMEALLASAQLFETLDFSAPLPTALSGAGEFVIERDARVDGLLLWTVVSTGAAADMDYLQQQQAWLPLFIPLPEGSRRLRRGETIKAQWSSQVTTGICPDYALRLELAGETQHCLSRWQETQLGTTVLHKKLAAAPPAAAGNGLPVDALRRQLATQLPDYMLPQDWLELPRLPLNNNGKLDRDALPAPAGPRRAAAVASRAPRDELERDLLRVWQAVLELESLGVDENFFDLGGDSISAVRLASALQRELGQGVSLVMILETPTIAGLADKLRDLNAAMLPSGMERGEL